MSGGFLLTPKEMREAYDVSAQTLAARAGVDTAGPLADDARTEAERARAVGIQLSVLQRQPRVKADPIYCALAAQYLPALMAAFSRATALENGPTKLINAISHTPYFVRFARTPAGAAICETHARRILAAGPGAPAEADTAAEAAQFLATVGLLQGFDALGDDAEGALRSVLRGWARRFRGVFAGEAAERCVLLLDGSTEAESSFTLVAEKISEPVTTCGAPTCSRKQTAEGKDLQKCSRCKTAVYCSAEHQKQAWSTHKSTCFTPCF